MNVKQPSTAAGEPTEIATVARGRSVDVPSGERRKVGHDPVTGEAIFAAVQRRYAEGQQVELPRSQITRLRELGFLTDPAAAPPSNGRAS